MNECPHPLKHIQAKCGCCIDCPSKIHMLIGEPTEEHLALHREAEAGIIHPYDENIKKIPIPQLVLRTPKDMMDEIVEEYSGKKR